jgi:hypothetical protein
MDIYTVYVDLREGASPDDYVTFKQLMLKEFRIGPIIPVGQILVFLAPVLPAATYSAEETH